MRCRVGFGWALILLVAPALVLAQQPSEKQSRASIEESKALKSPSISKPDDRPRPKETELEGLPKEPVVVAVIGGDQARPCSIPLVNLLPKATGKIRRMDPSKGPHAVRYLAPPAPACEE